MKKLLVIGSLAFGAWSYAQTCTVPAPVESAVTATGGFVDTSLADGGCMIIPQSPSYTRPGGTTIMATARPYNGNRCAIARATFLAAAKLDLNTGDGGLP